MGSDPIKLFLRKSEAGRKGVRPPYEILKMADVYSSMMSEMRSRCATLMSKSPAR